MAYVSIITKRIRNVWKRPNALNYWFYTHFGWHMEEYYLKRTKHLRINVFLYII